MNYRNFSSEDFALDQSFRKWVLGEESKENEFWSEWIAKNPDKIKNIKEARQIILKTGSIMHSLDEGKVSNIWGNILKHIDSKTKENKPDAKMVAISPEASIYSAERQLNHRKVIRNNSWWQIAAAVLFAVSVSAYFIFSNQSEQVSPGNSIQIVKSNPLGQKSTIFLNDGSEVILNSGSTLTYNENFGQEKRKIELQGEAYFKVAHNKEIPFVVKTGNIETTALGTEFNIRAFTDEPLSVALTRGKVSVVDKRMTSEKMDSIILVQGEGVQYRDNETMVKFIFDEKEYTSWFNGILYFNQASETEVFRKLEKWYGVTITPENSSPKKWGYTAEFEKKSLESVLQTMAFSMDFTFKINNDTIKIKYN